MAREHDANTPVRGADPLIGTIFDNRFHIDERLATGGFGAIYRARHVKSGHVVALKILLPELARDLGVVARFRREGDALTKLRNPHTIAAYELAQAADRTLFIVMELLRGQTLFERYRANGPLEWKRMVKIAREVCESLAEAHALGIVHRDLKPTNIHLEPQGDDPDFVKVLDFGIAKILGGSDMDAADITNAGQMIGTLDYMSPEQMVGGVVTGQTDIYTLGIVLYEVIAGCTPFPEALTAGAALNAMLKTRPDPLYLRAPVPEALDHVVMRCLERDTQLRYKTVTELSDALGSLLGAATLNTVTAVLSGTATLPKLDDDATAVTPPPEPVLEELRRAVAPRRRATPAAEWTDDDEQAPTATKRPDQAPPVARSLPRMATPVPQLVVAPFSTKRPSAPPPMPSAPPPPPPVAPPPPMVPTRLPNALPYFPAQQSVHLPEPPRASFDMGQLTARDAAIRRIVWIVVIVVAVTLGIALAML